MYRNTIAVLLLMFTLLLVNLPARAGTIATLPNKAGGEIVLTDIKCKSMSGMVAYGTHPSGATQFGCWFVDDIFVHITWSNGETRSYSLKNSGWILQNQRGDL